MQVLLGNYIAYLDVYFVYVRQALGSKRMMRRFFMNESIIYIRDIPFGDPLLN